MKTVTVTIDAWISEHSYIEPKDLIDPEPGIVNKLVYASNDMSGAGWVRAGKATITVELFDEKKVVEQQVETLRDQIKQERAESEAKVTRLQSQINDLLALTYEPAGEQA